MYRAHHRLQSLWLQTLNARIFPQGYPWWHSYWSSTPYSARLPLPNLPRTSIPPTLLRNLRRRKSRPRTLKLLLPPQIRHNPSPSRRPASSAPPTWTPMSSPSHRRFPWRTAPTIPSANCRIRRQSPLNPSSPTDPAARLQRGSPHLLKLCVSSKSPPSCRVSVAS